ncbi:hypothetical protein N665_0028s0039 [Sinapis alba]|nr:hypothetical protein N665_0028s0039 [Sinapis alba]
MTSAPVLALPDFAIIFVVESDASAYGIGAVLMKNSHPIAYFSAVLSDRQQVKPISECELMAIVLAIQKWHHYLLERKFIVHTDQKSLNFLLEQREVSLDYQIWLTKLLGCDFDIIVYKPGIENKAADGLSRISQDSGVSLNSFTVPTSLHLQDLLAEIDKYESLQIVKKMVMTGQPHKEGYSVVQRTLLYKGRLVILPCLRE